MTEIRWEEVTEPCWACGHPRPVRRYTQWPVLHPGVRSAAEHAAADRVNEAVREQTARRQNERV